MGLQLIPKQNEVFALHLNLELAKPLQDGTLSYQSAVGKGFLQHQERPLTIGYRAFHRLPQVPILLPLVQRV